MIALTNDLMSLVDFSEKCWAYTLPNNKKAFIAKSQAEFRQDENGVVSLFVADWMVYKLHNQHSASSFIFLHAPKENEGQDRFADLVVNKPAVEVVEEKTETVVAKIETIIENNIITTDLVVGDMVTFQKEFSKKLSQKETSEFTGQYGKLDFIL
ncbi:hypothetical protein UFOVP338_70 [uncultured Caudovirales phage]|uniref:Uncharacterized protein n=1 Tax=uncultured Caudovirales phage TaxID=2100421 RepID=A0A6J5LYN0_9CAUD|nr:hypothetical protein UFOVP338_70 [uncultured Caudovirales phage]